MDDYLKVDSDNGLVDSIMGNTETPIAKQLFFNNLPTETKGEEDYSKSVIASTNSPIEKVQLGVDINNTDPSDAIPFETPQEITVKRFRLKKR